MVSKKIICCPFKVIYKTHFQNYDIDVSWTITQFLTIIIDKIKKDFIGINEKDKVEIILAGQAEGEIANKINPDNHITFGQKFGSIFKYLGFYIRTSNLVMGGINNPYNINRRNINQNSQIQNIMDERQNLTIQEIRLLFQSSQRFINRIQSSQMNKNKKNCRDNNKSSNNSIVLHNKEDCVICLDSKNKFNIISCAHKICSECYVMCYDTNNKKCPICRIGVIEI